MEGEGCAEASSEAAREAAYAPARRGGGVKGHNAAAGLAGGGRGREPRTPSARVEKRQHQSRDGRLSRSLPRRRAALHSRGFRHQLSPLP